MKLKNILNIRNWKAKYWFWSGKEDRKLDYNLNEESLVFEIGAFTGNTTRQIWNKHHCNIYAFEPVKKFYEQIKTKVPENDKIRLYNIGLAEKTGQFKFFLKDISSSQYVIKDKNYQEFKEEMCKLKDIEEFIEENNIKHIDLMVLDIEGSEYEFLIRLIKSGKIKIIKYLMIQFHKTVKDCEKKRKEIRKLLKQTHRDKYTLPFVWEKWERRE